MVFAKATARFRCGGPIHKAVLTDKGRLLLPDHPIEELRRLLNYREVGGQLDCACAALLLHWQKGLRAHIHRNLAPFRSANSWEDRTVWRIQRRKAQGRDNAVKLAGEHWFYHHEQLTRRWAAAIVATLRHRGYRSYRHHDQVQVRLLPGEIEPDNEGYSVDHQKSAELSNLISLHMHGSGYVEVRLYDAPRSSYCTILKDDFQNPPLLFLTDLAEQCYWRRRLDDWRAQCCQRRQTYLHEVIDTRLHNKVAYLLSGLSVGQRPNWSNGPDMAATVRFEVADLTPQAAELVARALAEMGERVNRLRKASDRRLHNPNRFPAPER